MNFRPYHDNDKAAVVAIFESNCPRYFQRSDQDDLIHFLDTYADENYLVVEEGGQIIGCGGHYTKADVHGIAWAMFQRQGIGPGRLLTVTDAFFAQIDARIRAENTGLDTVIHTTQLMERLFNRYGFETERVVTDGFGLGLDECTMRKRAVPG